MEYFVINRGGLKTKVVGIVSEVAWMIINLREFAGDN